MTTLEFNTTTQSVDQIVDTLVDMRTRSYILGLLQIRFNFDSEVISQIQYLGFWAVEITVQTKDIPSAPWIRLRGRRKLPWSRSKPIHEVPSCLGRLRSS
jgi:hypothetical protein